MDCSLLTPLLLLLANADPVEPPAEQPAAIVAKGVDHSLPKFSLTPYFVTFGSLVAAGVGAPIPEELPVVGGGVWAALPDIKSAYGNFRWLMLPVCILGVVIADGLLYGIGRMYGTRLLEFRFMKKLMPPDKKARIEQNFEKYGIKILLFARLLPGIRSPIFIMSGVMKMPLYKFIIADGIYAVPGVSLLFFLAWWFGDAFQQLIVAFEARLHFIRPLLIVLLILAILGYLLYKFLRKPVVEGDPPDIPLMHLKDKEKATDGIAAELQGNGSVPAPTSVLEKEETEEPDDKGIVPKPHRLEEPQRDSERTS